jgi:hypothetical protein
MREMIFHYQENEESWLTPKQFLKDSDIVKIISKIKTGA